MLTRISKNVSGRLRDLFSDKQKRREIFIRSFFVLIALLSILSTRHYIYSYNTRISEEQAAEAFAKMYYPVLDKLYASGDFENLRREVHRLKYQEGASAISNWSHIPVLHYYTQGSMVRDARTALENGTDDLQILSDGVWAALTILFKEDDFESNELFSEVDRQMIRSCRKEAKALLAEDLSLKSDEIETIHDSCLLENGEVDYEQIESYVKEYYKKNRTFTIS